MLTTFPQCKFKLEFPEILSQNYICYQWLSVSGISEILHCGILINMPYCMHTQHILEPLTQKRLSVQRGPIISVTWLAQTVWRKRCRKIMTVTIGVGLQSKLAYLVLAESVDTVPVFSTCSTSYIFKLRQILWLSAQKYPVNHDVMNLCYISS